VFYVQVLGQHSKSLTRTLNSTPSSEDVGIKNAGAFAVDGGGVLLNETLVGDWSQLGPMVSVLMFPVMDIWNPLSVSTAFRVRLTRQQPKTPQIDT